MRSSFLRFFTLASCLLPACGGGTPPPKGESEAVEYSSAKSDRKDTETTESTNSAAAGSEAATNPAAPPASRTSSGDLVVPQADDPWMAPHQMPASDVLKRMRSATGRVNACWHAAKRRDPSVRGEVKIRFVVTHEGSVRVWRNEDSTTSDGEAIQCVGEVLKSMKFPPQKSPGDAWAIYQTSFGD